MNAHHFRRHLAIKQVIFYSWGKRDGDGAIGQRILNETHGRTTNDESQPHPPHPPNKPYTCDSQR